MLVIAALIAAQLMDHAVEGEAAAGDAVAVAPADGAHIATCREIGIEPGFAEHDIRKAARAVGHMELKQSRAQLHDPGAEAVAIGNGEGVDRASLDLADDA